MLNVSPIGRNCSREERNEFEKFDLANKVRPVAEIWPRCVRDVAEMRPRCRREVSEISPRCSRDLSEMQPRSGRELAAN